MARLVSYEEVFSKKCPRCLRVVEPSELRMQCEDGFGGLQFQEISVETMEMLRPQLSAIVQFLSQVYAGEKGLRWDGPLPNLLCVDCARQSDIASIAVALTNSRCWASKIATDLAPHIARMRAGAVEVGPQRAPVLPAPRSSTPLHAHVRWNLMSSQKMARIEWEAGWAEIIRLCTSGGECVHALNARGESALWMLTDVDDFQFLAAEDVHVVETSRQAFRWRNIFEQGMTRYETAARLLMRFGADVCARHPDTGETPLTNAAGRRAHTAATALLLKLGADPYARNGKGEDAFSVATEPAREVLEYWRTRRAPLSMQPQ